MVKTIGQLKEKYSFLKLTKQENDEINIIIENSKTNEIIIKIEEKLEEIFIKKINNSEVSNEVIEMYVRHSFDARSNENDFFEFISILRKANYEVNEDVFSKIISNNYYLKKIIENFSKKYEINDTDELLIDILNAYYYADANSINSKIENIVDDNTDSIHLYFKDISRFPLLTKEDEQDLFSKYSKTSDNSEKKEIKDRIINCNQRLIVSIARTYSNSSMGILDLCSEGNLGLITAIEKFDYKRGNKFSTYATYWINQAIRRAIAEQSRAIRVPVYKHELYLKISKAYTNYVAENGVEPRIEDLYSYLNKEYTMDEIKEYYLVSQPLLNINQKTSYEDDTEFGDYISDDKHNTEEEALSNFYKEEIEHILDALKFSYREKMIIKFRWGITKYHTSLTLKETSVLFDITKERVRQIEDKSMRILTRKGKYVNLKEAYKKQEEKNNISVEDIITLDEAMKLIKFIKDGIDLPEERYVEKNLEIDKIICKLVDNNVYEEFIYKYANFIFDRYINYTEEYEEKRGRKMIKK